MKFDKHFPTDTLKDYIKYYVVSENDVESEYKIFPSAGLVTGIQYKGQLSSIKEDAFDRLSLAGITGFSDSYKIFKNITMDKIIFANCSQMMELKHSLHKIFHIFVILPHIWTHDEILYSKYICLRKMPFILY